MREDSPQLVRSLDAIAGVLAGLSDERSDTPDAFYDSLCASVCSLTSLRRAVIFRWDSARRRVRAAGSHDIDLAIFADDYVNVDVLPAARDALERDEVVESRDPGLSERYAPLVTDRSIVVTPMVGGDRWVGVMIGDRLPDAPPLSDAERHLLWSLGKAAALAATARIATHQELRARDLEARIDLARELHDGVIQRLFGISLVLSGAGPLDTETRARAAAELQAALGDLREALQRPLARRSRPTGTTLADELVRLGREHVEIGLHLAAGAAELVPEHLEPLAQSVLVEAIRNAKKHAEPTTVAVRISRADGAFVLDIVNDGVDGIAGRSGMGLRLAALEALHEGGLLEFGPHGTGTWQVRLAVPDV